MTLHLWLVNLAHYSAQIAALIVVGSLSLRFGGLRRPDVRLTYQRLLLIACLLLPFVQPWKRPESEVETSVAVQSSAIHIVVPRRNFHTDELIAALLALGILARLSWLGLGMARLRRYRQRGTPLNPLPPVFDRPNPPAVYLSTEIPGPVTFGFRRPAILLPPDFVSAAPEAQEAIGLHELVHIQRHDWTAAMFEECVRSLMWFHPAIWWLLAEIQLAREQTVDAEVLRLTGAREPYVEALLAAARGPLVPDLAPASLFLRKTHLAQRLTLILKEVPMSRKRIFSSLAAISGVVVLAARFAMLYFPISAPAQDIVKGNVNLVHRAPVHYPAGAIDKGVQGTVVVSATLDEHGAVADARVVSGPEPLRKSALQSVLDWHYAAGTASPVEVAIDFKLPAGGPATAAVFPTMVKPGVIQEVRYNVPPAVRDAVAAALPVREGDPFAPDTLDRMRQAVQGVDEHLAVAARRVIAGDNTTQYSLTISYAVPVNGSTPQRIRVGGNVQAAQIVTKVTPKYPPQAKLDRVQGTVRLNVVINKDGTVQSVEVASGDPELSEVAAEAVRNWVYRPTLLNGQPVEVATVVDVNFTLRN